MDEEGEREREREGEGREGEGGGQKRKSIRKRVRAIQTCEVAEWNGNLFATTAMTGVGGRSIS